MQFKGDIKKFITKFSKQINVGLLNLFRTGKCIKRSLKTEENICIYEYIINIEIFIKKHFHGRFFF